MSMAGKRYYGTDVPRTTGPHPDPARDVHWAVSVAVDGNQILCIESNCLSGAEDVDQYAEVIRNCAKHLLSFIGEAKR